MNTFRRGTSFIELMFIVAVIGSLAMAPRIASNMMAALFKQRQQAQMQMEAQVAVYGMMRDVRNCFKIVSVAPDKFVVNTFDHHKGYDTATVPLFSSVNVATVTYSFVSTNNPTYILRHAVYGGISYDRKILVGMTSPPTSSNYLFRQPDGATLTSPEGVEVCLRIDQGFFKNSPLTIQTRAMRRVFNTTSTS